MGRAGGITRREGLGLLAFGLSAWPLAHAVDSADAADAPSHLVATWAEGGHHHAGQLSIAGDALRIAARIELPTRAHGLCAAGGGEVLVAARRPGDWLLRWQPGSGAAHWHWIEGDRRLNGHVLRASDGQRLWTTETDQADAAGLIGVRDPRSLQRLDEWPTHGMDPHALLVLPQPLGEVPAGALIVANGGIPTQSETGRSHRDLHRMDPSLVALDPRDGRLLGQWRLPDPRLSIRHLAFDPVSRRVGIALQAEHDERAMRDAAPILATWDGRALEAADPAPGAQGYGGDIGARPGGGFWVGATRGGTLTGWDPQGRVVAQLPLQAACAVATRGGHWWAGGGTQVLADGSGRALPMRAELDNHWIAWG